MANLIVILLAIVAVVIGAAGLIGAALDSASSASGAWDMKTERFAEAGRTQLKLITADAAGGGEDIDITIRNTGQTALRDFSWWDVMVQYYESPNNDGLKALSLTSTSTAPTSGQWAVEGIYLNAANATAELYGPNILDPGEEMKLRANISPAIPAQTENQVTIATPNGIRLMAPFSR